MLITITNEQKVNVTLAPTTAAGNPGTLDGVPQWAVVTGDATIEPSADGLSCYLISGEPGLSQISVTADADLGEGVTNLTDTVDLAVIPATVSQLGLLAGTPELK